jgi:hypothetical protein
MASAKISLSDLKKEVMHLSAKELVEVCINMAKLKRENKEYLTYILYNANNIEGFIAEQKLIIDEQFANGTFLHTYIIKKTLRKIVKTITQQIKFAKNKKVDIELLIHFCNHMKENLLIQIEPVIDNIYLSQLKKIEKAQSMLHEDLQYDYKKQIEELQEAIY